MLWEKLVTLQVNRIQKAKTSKNTSKKVTSTKSIKKSESKKQTSKKSQGTVAPSEEKSYIRVEAGPQNAEEYMTPLSLAGMALASGVFLVFRRRTEGEIFSEK